MLPPPLLMLLLFCVLLAAAPQLVRCEDSGNTAMVNPTALAIVMLIYHAFMGVGLYLWGYSIGYYLRYVLSVLCCVLCASMFLEFNGEKMSSWVTWVVVLLISVLCLIAAYFIKRFSYFLIGFFIGMLTLLILPDLATLPLMYGWLSLPISFLFGAASVYFGFKLVLTLTSILGALHLMKLIGVLAINPYGVFYTFQTKIDLQHYYFHNGNEPPMPFYVPLALGIGALILALPRILVGALWHKRQKSQKEKQKKAQKLSQSGRNSGSAPSSPASDKKSADTLNNKPKDTPKKIEKKTEASLSEKSDDGMGSNNTICSPREMKKSSSTKKK